MKKLAVVLVLILTIFSCSKDENNLGNEVKKSSKFRLEYSQEGDLDFGDLTFFIVSDKEVTNIVKDQVFTKEQLSEIKTYSFETIGKAENFSFSYTHVITLLTNESKDKMIKTNIKVYKDDVLIFEKGYLLNKDNLGETENSDDLNN
ncbi:hypothetical protein [Tenacibaculum maritimum]|uniref:hypothetical protein n=1 Tax=Tenacibaculum maritimum TaxID=107401 RepID=UPI00387620DF